MIPVVVLRRNLPGGWLEVRQQGSRRSLWFDDGILQSEIDLERPDWLPNPANRAMLAHLIFRSRPRRVLLAGCGGGAVARWFRARSPATAGVAVELSAEVAQVALSHFDFPGPDSGWRLVVDDVRAYLAQDGCGFDFILVDIAAQGALPDWIGSPGFLQACRRRLSGGGVLTLNVLAAAAGQFSTLLWNVRRVFDRHTLCLSVPDYGNVMVLAFDGAPGVERIEQRLAETADRWGLELGELYARLRRQNPPGSGVF